MGHTPTPWKIEYGHMQSQSKIRYWQITDGQDAICNNQFCYAQDSDANAAHIVKCVNMHDELVEVLSKFMDFKDDDYVPNILFARAEAILNLDSNH